MGGAPLPVTGSSLITVPVIAAGWPPGGCGGFDDRQMISHGGNRPVSPRLRTIKIRYATKMA